MAKSLAEGADGSARVLETLANEQRMSILGLVSRKPVTVEEISEQIGLRPVSVRFHLRKLAGLGLIEGRAQRRGVGRPRYLYSATERSVEVAYPPRSYRHLASVLLKTLLTDPDQSQVSRNLRKVGREMGSDLARGLKAGSGVADWDGPALKMHLVEGLMENFGAQPETVKCSKDAIQYRLNNCPFKELAQEYPQVLCEQLDDTLNISLLKELDSRIDWRKIRCIGHGDSYCEYLATRKTSARTSAGPG